MAYYLPSSAGTDGNRADDIGPIEAQAADKMADLKVFWGPEICRLEYLMHLVHTGRIRDEAEESR